MKAFDLIYALETGGIIGHNWNHGDRGEPLWRWLRLDIRADGGRRLQAGGYWRSLCIVPEELFQVVMLPHTWVVGALDERGEFRPATK